MDDLLNAPLWQKVLAVVLIAGFAFWGYYNYLYVPKVREINSLKNTLKSVEMEIKLITPPEVADAEHIDIKEIIKKEIEDLMKKIPTEQEVPFIIDELITRVGRGLNIDYRLIQPQSIAPEGKYKKLPFKVSFLSDYTDLNLYMKKLKGLPATVRIDTLSLNKASAPPKLKVDMMLSIFIMPGAPVTKKEDKFYGKRKPYLFDPFFKPVEVVDKGKKKKAPVELQGIWMGRTAKAIINEKVLTPGDSIAGYELIIIEKNSVTLLKDNKKLILEIKGGR
jgi:Tfp pilus assembly protein PilO